MAETKRDFTIPILVILLAVACFLAGSFFTKIRLEKKTADLGGAKIGQGATKAPQQPENKILAEELETTIGNFLVTKEEACLKENKPAVYMFGSSRCPHCNWEHPIFERVVAKFGSLISVRDNMDVINDKDIQEKYKEISRGAVPFIVIGCKYIRLGSGENLGKETEEKILTSLVCKLTNSRPGKVCGDLKDMIDSISQ